MWHWQIKLTFSMVYMMRPNFSGWNTTLFPLRGSLPLTSVIALSRDNFDFLQDNPIK